MKKYIFIALLAVSVISCKENKGPHSNNESLVPGPIVHQSLTEAQLDKIKYIQETFYEVYPVTLDKTIENFKRDQHPDNEINVWLNMAKAFLPFAEKNAGQDKFKTRQEAFKLILMRSMMSEKEAIQSAELKVLTEGEIQEILSNYTLEAKPIQVK